MWMAFVGLLGCPDPTETVATGPTWWQDVKPIVDARCGSCHQPGDIGPVPLTTYEEVALVAALVRDQVANDVMPPWPPADDCNTYDFDRSLAASEKETLLAWVDAGAPEGDADAPAAPLDVPADTFAPDVTVTLPEPYTPTRSPDDYRCQLIEWPVAEATHIVGVRVSPDQRQMVHHTIVFAAAPAAAQRFRDLDAAEDGPGYTCFGGPTGLSGQADPDLTLAELNADSFGVGSTKWVGSWVPGARGGSFPAGTGIAIEPGSLLIVQMHYNTAGTDAVADQSSIEFDTQAEVDREAMILPFTDLGWVTGSELIGDGPMLIPAGGDNVVHETVASGTDLIPTFARLQLGLPGGAPLVIHAVGHHMHQLGTKGHTELREPGGTQCLLDIPDWDFHWQSAYRLTIPATFDPEDSVALRCNWDNSFDNQPVINGEAQPMQDVYWGEGTADEMCLATFYVTGP